MQALASIDLKPSLVRGEVRRLPAAAIETETRTADPVADLHEIPQPDEAEYHTDPNPSVIDHELPATPASSGYAEPQGEQPPASDSDPPPVKTPRLRKRRSSGPRVANGKDPWGDEEIKKLIQWKVQGMTHKEAGVSSPRSAACPSVFMCAATNVPRTLQAKLGRTEPACAIRHSIVLKQARWLDYSRSYREKWVAGEVSDGEDEDAAEGESEQAGEDEEMKSAEKKEDEKDQDVGEMTTYEDPKEVEMEEYVVIEEQ